MPAALVRIVARLFLTAGRTRAQGLSFVLLRTPLREGLADRVVRPAAGGHIAASSRNSRTPRASGQCGQVAAAAHQVASSRLPLWEVLVFCGAFLGPAVFYVQLD